MSLSMKTNKGGFFCCNTIRMVKIIDFINEYNKIPEEVISSNVYGRYKPSPKVDVTFDFFKDYKLISNIDVNFSLEKILEHGKISHKIQFSKYHSLPYHYLTPIVNKYFSPSERILSNEQYLLKKYDIKVEKYIAIYYRGTDKYKEMTLASYDLYLKKVNNILSLNPDLKLMILSDSQECLDFFRDKFKDITIIKENRTSYTKEGIHNESKPSTNYTDMFNLLATFLIISKCKYIVCGSGNGALWINLYRGHGRNVYQCNRRGIFLK